METDMQGVFQIMKMIAVLVAAIVVGNWFLSELKKARVTGAPWYQPYLTIPGILVILAVLSPVILKLLGVI
jgi:hypothetical protein